MHFTYWFISVISLQFFAVDSLKLLLVFPVAAKSHYFLGNELGKGLAKLGHDVTILAAFNETNPPANYKTILVTAFEESYNASNSPIDMFAIERISPYIQLFVLGLKVFSEMNQKVIEDPAVQELIHSKQHFDAVIIEEFWLDALKGFAYRFDAQLILFSTIGPNRWVNNLVANPSNPSYIPDLFLSFNGENMTFYERLYNLVFGLVSDLFLFLYFYPGQKVLMKKHFSDEVDFEQLHYNVPLVLTNSHESIYEAVPHVPNMIDIGGFHVSPPKKLDHELQDFLDNAKEGVIYFSLGSAIVPSTVPQDKKNILLKVLGSRKERVLWKWDEEKLENRPENVMISKWFPQQGILAHPNCKLFISHGGLLSTTETVNFGVPVLALPVFGDQKMNAVRITSKGFGLTILFSELTEERLRNDLDELLGNPKYAENAKKASELLHDRPMEPIKVADYWIKYVVRHKGAPHLRVAGINLPLYKYYMLDVFGAILAVVWLSILVTVKLVRLCCSRKTSSKLGKTKKNKYE